MKNEQEFKENEIAPIPPLEGEKELLLIGEKLTDTDKFYLNWAQESIKENIKNYNDIFKLIITICSGLLGLSIVFENILIDKTTRLLTILEGVN